MPTRMKIASERYKFTTPEPTERQLHIGVRDLLNLCLAPPAVWTPFPVGVTRLTAEQHAQYSAFGVKRGFPDILIFFQKTWGIELKKSKGRLTKTRVGRTPRGGPRELIGQQDMFPKLLASGAWGAIEIARSIDDVCRLLDQWGIPRLGGHSWLAAVLPTLNAQQPVVTSVKLVGGDSA